MPPSNKVVLPDWLRRQENYIPLHDTNSFLDKSLRSLLSILHKISSVNSDPSSCPLPLHPVLKLTGTLVMVFLTVAGSQPLFLAAALLSILVQLLFLPLPLLILLLKIGLTAAGLHLLILLPSWLWLHTTVSFIIPGKLFITVTALNLLSFTTPWAHLTKALRQFRVPHLFIFLLDITLKYIYLLGRLSILLLQALRLRSIGHNPQKHFSLAGILGTLFLKSREQADELHAAMLCRGFTGIYNTQAYWPLHWQDACYAASLLVLLLLFLSTSHTPL